MSRRALLTLLSAVTIAYLNSFAGSFQFDDFNVIVDNPKVHTWAAWFHDLPGGIRPLLKLSYTLNWTSGLGLFGFHLANFLIHLVNSFIVLVLSRKIISLHYPGHTDTTALLAALFFALHPVQTEAVTYISGRSMSLMTLFYLLSILFYVRGIAEKRQTLYMLFSPLFFITAVLVKETALTLPLALVLWERTGKDVSSRRSILRRQSVHWLLLALFFVTLALHKGYGLFLTSSFETRGIFVNLISQIDGITYLMSRLFFLNGMNIDPDLPVVLRWSPGILLKAIFLSAVIFAGLLSLRQKPLLGFGILWFFLHLLPTNSFIPRIDIANERHLYSASWGIFLIVVDLVLSVRKKLPGLNMPVRSATAIALVLLCLFTLSRNHAYRNEIALWEDAVRKSPLKPRPHNNLGYSYFLAGRYGDAKREYLEALRLRPDYVRALGNLEHLESVSRERQLPE